MPPEITSTMAKVGCVVWAVAVTCFAGRLAYAGELALVLKYIDDGKSWVHLGVCELRFPAHFSFPFAPCTTITCCNPFIYFKEISGEIQVKSLH